MSTQKTRLNTVRLRKIFKDGSHAEGAQVPHRLAYTPNAFEEYSFENKRILINGMDILSMVGGPDMDIELLACLAGAIEEYRHVVWERYGTKFKAFNAQTQAVLEKILKRMNRYYEELYGGLRVSLQGGRLWINDIDPKVVLALFLSNPTMDRRSYLQSIHTKLGLILEGKAGNSFSHGILERVRQLFIQIGKALENTAAVGSTPLLATAHHLGR